MLVIIVCISKHPFPDLPKDNIYLDGLWWVLCMMIFKVHSTTYCPSGMKEIFSSVQLSSVSQLCLTLCDPMDCSTPGLPVHHQLPEFTQTHVIESVMPSTISFSVIPFFSCLQSFPALRNTPMSQFFTSGGKSIGVSTSALVLPMNTQDWSPLGGTG